MSLFLLSRRVLFAHIFRHRLACATAIFICADNMRDRRVELTIHAHAAAAVAVVINDYIRCAG